MKKKTGTACLEQALRSALRTDDGRLVGQLAIDIEELADLAASRTIEIVREAASPAWDVDKGAWEIRRPTAQAGFIVRDGFVRSLVYEGPDEEDVIVPVGNGVAWAPVRAYGNAIAKAVWPSLAPPPPLGADSRKQYAFWVGRSARTFGLPFETVMALGPAPEAAATWRQIRVPSGDLTLAEVYNLNAGIDRRRSGIRACFVQAEPALTWEEFNELLPSPIEEMGQRYTKALAQDLLWEIAKDAAHHGVKRRPRAPQE